MLMFSTHLDRSCVVLSRQGVYIHCPCDAMTSTASSALGLPLLQAVEGELHIWVDADEGSSERSVSLHSSFGAFCMC